MASQATAVESGASASGGISRREFLYYIWGASIALVALQGAGLLLWFLIPVSYTHLTLPTSDLV